MENIIKADWDKFKAKFSENPQNNFEWFCYLLFCEEYKQDIGIFRYKNQSGIETNPIEISNEIIGWQAKFYDTTLSEHRSDLMSTIEKSKRDYPTITKIIFYSNQEWGQGRKQNEPQVKIDVEKKANDCGIEIDWRTSSFFESKFVAIENKNLAHHFFSLEKSIISLLDDKKSHTESILYEVQSNIEFKEHNIEIDRKKILDEIKSEINNKQVVIISGAGGVGKTAIVKKYYENLKGKIPFYIIKAAELNLNDVNELFYDFNLYDFIDSHKYEENKIMVIDSAERLLDMNNTQPSKELLSTLIKNNWKVIFTTRDNYLEDLNYQFIEIYKINPFNIHIRNLTRKELKELSINYKFKLTDDEKLLELIQNPFYLKEYLKEFKEKEVLSYINFKKKIWDRIIKKTKPIREQYFIEIATIRANQGQFFIKSNLNYNILDELVKDGVLGHESYGYFITHDIYEEWALEKFIDSEFLMREDDLEFFDKIGESLAIRRSFRKWLSEKLLFNDRDIVVFIEEIIQNNEIKCFWKDEILVAILLSDYSEMFFNIFKTILLGKRLELINRISFILRIACKEVDYKLVEELDLDDNLLSMELLLTKPRGEGWKSLIKFVYNNVEHIGMSNIKFIIQIINDWNNKFNEGVTTKYASLIALKYYRWKLNEDKHFFREDDVKEKLFETILKGAKEIKTELIDLFEEVINKRWNNHLDPYYDFISTILTKWEYNIMVIKVLPTHILKLAELFWTLEIKKNSFYSSRIDIDECFGVDDKISYYPSSSYQTPIYWLLQYNFKETVDFIIRFTDKAVEKFSNSELGKKESKIVNIYLGNNEYKEQYICDRIWNIYRGTQVNSYLLESIHMALEKFLLDIAKDSEAHILESWLLYLLKNTKSSSITSLVVSIVLAYPDKTFNIAKVLFKTKELFFYDTNRFVLEKDIKFSFSIGYGLGINNKMYQDERINSCNGKHRNERLEGIALRYQFFRENGISEKEANDRQTVMYKIFDDYYDELVDCAESNKTWRMYLARMDRRKMDPRVEQSEEGVIINFNPKLDDDLLEFRRVSSDESNKKSKYLELSLWTEYKFKKDDRCKEYLKYDDNPSLVLKEVQEILAYDEDIDSKNYYLGIRGIPGKACSVLIRDYLDKLTLDEKVFCKDIILSVSTLFLYDNYSYQISDGVESALYVLPLLLAELLVEKDDIKLILLFATFDDRNIGNSRFSEYAISAVLDYLWNNNFEDARDILLGYLILKPIYEKTKQDINKEKGMYYNSISKKEIIDKFIKENEEKLDMVVKSKFKLEDIINIEGIDLHILRTAFELLPLKIENKEYKKLAKEIITAFAKHLLYEDRSDRIDYMVKYNFIKRLSYLVLNGLEEDIEYYLEVFINEFNNSEVISQLFNEFIIAEDEMKIYNNFWKVWDLFKDKVINLVRDEDIYWNKDKIIESYLFANVPWVSGIEKWHSITDNNKLFFKEIIDSIGFHERTLYSISKLLNNIGSIYFDEGVLWLSNMISKNENLHVENIDFNTIYLVEKYIRKYIYIKREKIRTTRKLKLNVITILDFLIEKGSVTGYMLRENIL
ncbi:AVAST type 4 anti-phage nuclease Avs4 [Paraclostridium bifermentans]|uniref:AVAST type 4 anti-phage nuclease Avs4 n=1 Tax=Paraclostridium bifermentans TaxID=1490 RepID=UPI00241F4DD9|nr:AVAST type 4 anti-phage nuclease Avs4 [Paraclostridium bifermentans]